MRESTHQISKPITTTSATIKSASKAMAEARKTGSGNRMHRSMTSLPARPRILLHALLLPLLFCSLVWWGKSTLLNFWVVCIEFWMEQLRLPIHATLASHARSDIRFGWLYQERMLIPPSDDLLLIAGSVIAILSGISFLMRDNQLPIKYLLRILCAVLAISLAYFWFWPGQFPYTVTNHLSDLARMGYIFIFALPVMLAVGYYILNFSLLTKVAVTVGVLAYFAILIPHKIVLHCLVLTRGSMIFMPILYICFGALLDVLIFVAIYSWAISLLPAQAID